MNRTINRGGLIIAACLLLGSTLLPPGRARADSHVIRLSGHMNPSGQVMDFKISPDSRYVVYKADPDADGINELFSVPVDGGTPVKLNVPLPPGFSISGFEISPDGSRVAYGVPTGTPRSFDLYSVPVAGPAEASVLLNGPMIEGGNVLSFQFSPDSSTVVYRADQETDGVFELYSVPAAGPSGGAIKLNPALTPGGIVFSFQISPDSSRVVYMAEQDTDGVLELYSVPLYGPASSVRKVNSTPVPGGSTFLYAISPDSSRVVFIADLQTNDMLEIFSAPITGDPSSEVKLNSSLIPTGDVKSFAISPDSRWVVYRADQEIDFTKELYSVPIDGPSTSVTKLNEPLPSRAIIYAYEISPDSRYVVYRIDQRGTEINPLYSVPIQGPAAASVPLNPPQVPDGSATAFEITPDSRWVVYGLRHVSTGFADLYSAPLAGPADEAIQLNPMLPAGGSVFNFQISPDGSRVVYRAQQDSATTIELYSVPVRGLSTETVKLNNPMGDSGNVLSFLVSPDNRWVVFTADPTIDRTIELFSAGSNDDVLPPSPTSSPTPSVTPSPPKQQIFLPLMDKD